MKILIACYSYSGHTLNVAKALKKEINADFTIHKLLEQMEIKNPMTVVEKNLSIVPKDKYSDIIQEGDSLEVVGFFGGD